MKIDKINREQTTHYEIVDKINQIIGIIGDEKIEERKSCEICNWTNVNLEYGICLGCKNKEEPKSTLREIEVDKEAFNNMPNFKIHLPDCACGNHAKSNLREAVVDELWKVKQREQSVGEGADKIISLFKDTLLKEIDSINWELQSSHKVNAVIKQIIKNL